MDGPPHPPPPAPPQAWAKTRRAAVDRVAGLQGGAAPAPAAPLAADEPGDAWTEAHDTEVRFQQQKRFRRALDALQQGALTPAEIMTEFKNVMDDDDDGLGAARLLEVVNEVQAKQRNNYVRKNLAMHASSHRRAVKVEHVLRQARVFLDHRGTATSTAAALEARLAALQACEASRQDATAFVVADVSAPPQRILWHAVLGGGILMSLPFFLSGVGPAIAYEAAIKLRRVVWLSDIFLEQHSTLAHIVLMMMSKAGAAWKCVADRAEFVDILMRKAGRGKSADMLAFVGLRECGDGDIARARRLTATTAAGVLGKLRREHSSTGMCGR